MQKWHGSKRYEKATLPFLLLLFFCVCYGIVLEWYWKTREPFNRVDCDGGGWA